MFNRQHFCFAFYFLVATLSLTAVVGCSSVPAQETTHEPTPAVTAAPVDATPVAAQEMPPTEIAIRREATAPMVIQEPAPPVQDLGRISDEPVAEQIDLTATPDDLWEHLRRGFSMPDLDSPLVKDRENWYADKAAYLERVVERSKLYLYHIVDELEKRGMPTELALLPMVESAFDPMAYSRAHASGLWQFIPSTGKHYKLQQNRWYDARRDIVASTNAALDYLQFLYEMHGDWQLALASYNWGENAVARAIEKNRARGLPTDYASLAMPQETRYYVPKLQALKNIISDPSAFGIDLDSIPDEPYFATVPIQGIDLRVAAKLAEMPVQDLIALNPAHKRPVISAANSKTLVLPVDRVDLFKTNLARRTRPLVSWKTYRLKRGDKLDRLASQHRISLAKLKQVNGIVRHTRVRPGMELLLPTKGTAPDTALVPAVYRTASKAPNQRKTIYMVKRGDTLWGIAQRYDVSVDSLRLWNNLGRLKAGQRLVIHRPATAAGS